jgi:ArsR family transcriptional regulator
MKTNMLKDCCPELHQLSSAGFFQALCDPNRLLLVWYLLSEGPAPVTVLAKKLTVDISVVSRHLRILRDAGIISHIREGREVRYSANTESLAATLRAFASFVESSAGCCSEGVCCSPKKSKSVSATKTRKRKE